MYIQEIQNLVRKMHSRNCIFYTTKEKKLKILLKFSVNFCCNNQSKK